MMLEEYANICKINSSSKRRHKKRRSTDKTFAVLLVVSVIFIVWLVTAGSSGTIREMYERTGQAMQQLMAK